MPSVVVYRPSSMRQVIVLIVTVILVPVSALSMRFHFLRTNLVKSSSTRLQASFNPLSSFLGGMASSLAAGKPIEPMPEVDKAIQQVKQQDWREIRKLLESKFETDDERNFRKNVSMGYGVGSPLHLVRLFDESNKEEDIRVTFYRDSASWCPYCQKVWLALEEKRIPYRVEKINMSCYGTKPRTFLQLQPSGQIPVATIDGRTYGQSNDILYALEERFPQHKSLMPPAGKEMKAQELLRLERSIFSTWLYWLTGSGGEVSKQRFVESLNEVERELTTAGPFFLGKQVSLVDFMFAPFLERMAASLLYYKGFQMRVATGASTNYPALNRWFDAMEALASYQLTKSDYYTHCWDLHPQLGGCTMEVGGKLYARAIDGERSIDGIKGSWELPLQPHNGGIEPDWTWACKDEAAARREAVERVSANHEAIVRFAARGAGRKGMPPVMAPLADPNAIPSEAVLVSVDACIQTVCLALLEGTEKHEVNIEKLSQTIAEKGGTKFTEAVIESLSYMRDRVGVPRDMKLPAAQQLRAHTNWAIGKLLNTH